MHRFVTHRLFLALLAAVLFVGIPTVAMAAPESQPDAQRGGHVTINVTPHHGVPYGFRAPVAGFHGVGFGGCLRFGCGVPLVGPPLAVFPVVRLVAPVPVAVPVPVVQPLAVPVPVAQPVAVPQYTSTYAPALPAAAPCGCPTTQ